MVDVPLLQAAGVIDFLTRTVLELYDVTAPTPATPDRATGRRPAATGCARSDRRILVRPVAQGRLGAGGTAVDAAVAEQTIYHDQEHPSALRLLALAVVEPTAP